MKNTKHIVIIAVTILSCCFTVATSAQSATEWLQLSPLEVTLPALSSVKDVDDKIFKEDMLISYSTIAIRNLRPKEHAREALFPALQWEKVSTMQADTLMYNVPDVIDVSNKAASGSSNNPAINPTINTYATYLCNEQWLSGTLKLTLFCSAEVYIDGKKELTYTSPNISPHINTNINTKASTKKDTAECKTVKCTLIPGKHSVIIKTLSKGGKQFAAAFTAELPKNTRIAFTTDPQRGKNLDDVLSGVRVSSASISHDGKYALITTSETIDGVAKTNTDIYRVATKDIVYSPLANSQWLPGKNKIVYTKQEGKAHSLYTYDLEDKTTDCLIKNDSAVKNYTFSPDLSYLLYTQSESCEDKAWQLRKLDGIEDRQPYYRNRSWLCKYDIATGLRTRLTWGNLSTSLHDISRDGSKFIFSTSMHDYSEYPFRKQTVYLYDLKTNRADTLWANLHFGVSCSFSPNGDQLLVSGGPSAFGKIGENVGKNQLVNQYDTQLYLFTIATKQVEPITKNFNPSIRNTYWHKNGNIYLTVSQGDYQPLYAYNVKDKTFRKMDVPGDLIEQFEVAENGNTLIYNASDAQHPTAIYTCELDVLHNKETATLWADPNRGNYENVTFGELKDWDFQYSKTTLIDGRYYLPHDFDPTKKYPLIVYYYGGTTPVTRSFGGRYPFNFFAANGYVVYVLQPSGSIGYGQEFSARHQNNWGKITADEIIRSTKAFLKAHPFVDAHKVGCIGASYGGFTTMYLCTQTDIFTCAISHAGISSISEYWGYGYWGYGYSTNATAHSYPWNRKDIYVDQSPLFNADKVRTPLLLLHGTKDVNVPFAESFQFYTALKLLGKEAELVMIKDADHHVVEYKQRILWQNSIIAWFDKYLKDQPEWWKNLYKDKNL
ncbi:peptidase S9 [Bacteroidia bacterium]|nr:peptidase S9 [Bacteroidia bacterium]